MVDFSIDFLMQFLVEQLDLHARKSIFKRNKTQIENIFLSSAHFLNLYKESFFILPEKMNCAQENIFFFVLI